MFKFFIDGLEGARSLLDETNILTKAVSVVSPRLADWHSRGEHHLIVRMEDVGTPGPNAPSESDVESILAFTASLKDTDTILVNCHLGQSRSTAAMIGILLQHEKTIDEAYSAVEEHRPCLMPNMLICTHLDAILGLSGALVERNTEFIRGSLATTRLLKGQMEAKSKPSVDAMKGFLDLFK